MGATGQTGVVFHVPQSWLDPGGALMPFYRKAVEGFAGLEIPTRVIALDRDTLHDRIEADSWFHIVNHGRFRHERALMAGVAYVYPFWNLDPQGIRAFSGIGEKPFRPARIDRTVAKAFFTDLRRRWVDPRKSRYRQPEAAEDLPDQVIAVFFQSEAHRSVEETCHMTRWEMLEACLAAGQGPVVVKPHPRDLDRETYDRLLALQKAHPELLISQGNIHDLLSRAKRVVTINSAVGIEAYLHRAPVILCGEADFHHVAEVATTPGALTQMLGQEAPGRHYAKYLYWYFVQNCINAGQGNVARQILKKIRATGYRFDAE